MAKWMLVDNVMTMPGCSFRADAVDAADVQAGGWFSELYFLHITLDSGAQFRTAYVSRNDAFELLAAVARVMRDVTTD